MEKLWGGRFKKEMHPLVKEFTSSIHFDFQLAKYDVLGSIAHVKMLGKCKIISPKEALSLIKGLKEILADLNQNKISFNSSFEDIHSLIQNELEKRIGKTSHKLHIARSRNDQVSLDLRLYCRDKIKDLQKLIRGLELALLNLAQKNFGVTIPGFTHLQHAQVILFSHYLLAYIEMLERDRERLEDTFKRVNVLPLGSSALAGTNLAIDRKYVAKILDFSQVSSNSLDSVSDRDFVIEILSALSILGMHLSRFSEDLILYSSSEFGFIEPDEAFCTGSSFMPQKKNPDCLELIRGQTGRLFGNLINILVVMKGLPLSYNRDMQQDKIPLFDSIKIIEDSLQLLMKLVPVLKINQERLDLILKDEFFYAPDLAEYLIKKGLSWKEAQERVGKLVKYCFEKKKKFSEISLRQYQQFSKHFDRDIFSLLNPQASVSLKRSSGSTNPQEVKKELRKWAEELKRS